MFSINFKSKSFALKDSSSLRKKSFAGAFNGSAAQRRKNIIFAFRALAKKNIVSGNGMKAMLKISSVNIFLSFLPSS